MFQPGNKYGRGRPPYSLRSPEILLPVIFSKGNLNWAHDFISIYRKIRDNPTKVSTEERQIFKVLYELLPYLVTKIQIKDLDLEKLVNKESAASAKAQTDELVKLLENEQNGRKSAEGGSSGSVEGR